MEEEEEEEDLSSSSSSLLKNDEKRANADDLTIVLVPPLTTTTLFFFFCVIVGTTLDFASFEEDGSVARIVRVLLFYKERACVVLFFVSKSQTFSKINSQIERENRDRR